MRGLIGESFTRKEDEAYLRGRGRYIDDIVLAGMLHLGVVRSTHAHARIGHVEKSRAAQLPGVLAVLAAEDLPELAKPIPPFRLPRKFRSFDQPVLARDIVRYVGEAVAVVVAEDPRLLADALEAVTVEYESVNQVVHESWPDNLAHVSRGGVGDPEAAMKKADVVVSEHFRHARLAGMPIETRGALAYEDAASGTLVVVSSTQHTYTVRKAIAAVLGLPEERLRVIAPDVGGAFGAKAQNYPEEFLVAALALRLARPVKWVEGRNEHFVASCHDREQEHEIRAGFARDGRLVALDDRFRADFGAYPVQEDSVTMNTINHLCAPYKVANFRSECANTVSNKTFSAAYRAAGRPEAAFVMERMMDLAARRLKIDPAEIRRRNLVRPADMPYRPGLTYKDGVPIAYDPADFPAAFDKLLALIGYENLRKEQSRAGTRRLGIGLACYVQGTGLGPFEGANVRVDADGKVYVYTGCSSQGQGHATTLAQICAEELGVRFEDVVIVGADTTVLAYGFGAMASRIAANAGPAVAHAARAVRKKAQLVAASLLEAAAGDIEIVEGRARVVGTDRSVPLANVARSAVRSPALKTDPGLNACTYFSPETVTWAFGAQAAAVEVDIETCEIRILKYAAVHDCGRSINPMLVDGQLHGGIAQGLGAALMEELVYDSEGQLRTGSFMDYAMPRAQDLPSFVTAHVNHPSAINDLGIKGVGESGVIPTAGVIANAVEDALADFGITIREVPITPLRLFNLLGGSK